MGSRNHIAHHDSQMGFVMAAKADILVHVFIMPSSENVSVTEAFTLCEFPGNG